jgi:prenylcysteine oxidase/farnesylcysteine lyase
LPRVGIIGAGAGGSSAAFWIAKAKERYGLDVAIDIYERDDYIGGRKSLNSSL